MNVPTYVQKIIEQDQEVRSSCDAVFEFIATIPTDEVTRKVMRKHMRTIHDHIAATTSNPPKGTS